MESVSVSLDIKGFQSLLTGLIQKNFHQSSTVTYETLLNKLYSNSELGQEEIRNEMLLFESILRKAGQDNWSDEVLEEFLRARDFPVDHTRLFVNVWNRESGRVHQKLLQKVTYNHSLANLSWRVDMKAMSKASAEINQSIAFFEMDLQNRSGLSGPRNNKIAKFEMNRDEIQDMIDSLQEIQKAYDTITAST